MTRLTKRTIYLAIVAVFFVTSMWIIFGNNAPKPKETHDLGNYAPKSKETNVLGNYAPNPKGKKTILLWTKFFGTRNYVKNRIKACQNQCRFTSDRSQIERSDALMFHLFDTDVNDLPKFRTPNQRWVLLHHESPPYTPSFLKNLDGLINWTITYRLDSDIILSPIAKRRTTTLRPSSTQKNFHADKTNDAFWFVSNCKTGSNREAYVRELSKTIEVTIVGHCGNRSCVPKMSDKCYEQYAKRYRYYLSFENSLCKDYVTEKFFHLVDYDVIPVVFTDTDMTRIAPNHSYINALDFKSPTELGNFLNELSRDETRYNSYFDWKEQFEYGTPHIPYPCLLCDKLLKDEPAKVWDRLYYWFVESVHCRRWPDDFQRS